VKKTGTTTTVRPKTRRTIRALGGRRIMIESFGRRAPMFLAISGGSDAPIGAWISPVTLRKLIKALR